jgi:hypothetical protein
VNFARIGATMSFVLLIAGASTAAYVYATEVPEGSQRVTFRSLRPEYEIGDKPAVVGKLPPEIMALDGQQVFIKGYMRVPAYLHNIDKFLLVRDDKSCCFGPIDNVQYWDQVAVTMKHGLLADYHKKQFKLAGILRIHPERVGSPDREPVFELVANYID